MDKKRKILILIALGLAIFVVVLDTGLMNIAIRAIIDDLNTTAQTIQSMITIYSLVMAMFTLIGARLGDIIGRKNIFIIGTILFGTGALIATFAPSVTYLMIGWSIIEGIGASLMMPATLSLIASEFEKKDLALGLGIWGGISALGAALGPIIGGFLTEKFTWRLAFFIEVIPIIIIILLSPEIPEKHNYTRAKSLDIKGSLYSALGLGTLVYAILNANKFGWITALNKNYEIFHFSITFWLILLSFCFIYLFARTELQCEKNNCSPLIELSIFRNKSFTISTTIALLVNLAEAGALFIIPLFLIIYRGYTPIQLSISLIPLMIAVFIMSLYGSRFVKYKKLVVIAGLSITTISAYWLSTNISPTTTIDSMWRGLLLLGIGIGLIMSQLTNITISSVSVDEASEASGLNSTLRNLGTSLGTAIIGTILFGALNTTLLQDLKANPLIPPTVRTKLITQIKENKDTQVLKTMQKHSKESGQIKLILDNSFVLATQKALNVTVGFLALSTTLALFLPSRKEN